MRPNTTLLTTIYLAMKTPKLFQILFLLFFLSSISLVHAQQLAQWKHTQNQTKVILDDAADYVGIGPVNPLFKLHVSSTLLSPGQFQTTGKELEFYLKNMDKRWAFRLDESKFHIFDKDLGEERISIDKSGRVGIGNASPSAQFHVNSVDPVAAKFENLSQNNGSKVGIENYVSAEGVGNRYGVINRVHQKEQGGNNAYGMLTELHPGGAGEGIGLYNQIFETNNPSGQLSGIQTSIKVPVEHASQVYGEYISIDDGGVKGIHVGVYADPGKGGTQQWAFYGIGNNFSTGSSYVVSDRKFKKEVKYIDDAMDKIMRLKAKTYNYDQQSFGRMNLPQEKQYGFIAQELEEVFPSMVMKINDPASNNSKQFRAVNYTALIPVMVSGLQEQQADQEHLIAQNKELQDRVERLEALVAQLSKKAGLSDALEVQAIGSIDQNFPNPVEGMTSFKFEVPTDAQQVSLDIYNLNGQKVYSYLIYERGVGAFSLDMSFLTSGAYTYALSIDGKLTQSRKMIVQ